MKESIVGYLTALANIHSDAVENHCGANIIAVNLHRSFVNELNALLDFVEDIPEENTEALQLKIKIKDYEESLRTMTVVEKNLHKKIAELTFTNKLMTMLGGKTNG